MPPPGAIDFWRMCQPTQPEVHKMRVFDTYKKDAASSGETAALKKSLDASVARVEQLEMQIMVERNLNAELEQKLTLSFDELKDRHDFKLIAVNVEGGGDPTTGLGAEETPVEEDAENTSAATSENSDETKATG